MVTTIGIDPHKATHTAVAIDESETVLGELTVPADRYQTTRLLDWAGTPIRFHDLRHSHVALLIQQGTHPAVIAAQLGHTSVKTVFDVYGHLSEGLDRDAADTLQPPWTDSDVHAMCTRHREQEPPWRLNGPSGAGRTMR